MPGTGEDATATRSRPSVRKVALLYTIEPERVLVVPPLCIATSGQVIGAFVLQAANNSLQADGPDGLWPELTRWASR